MLTATIRICTEIAVLRTHTAAHDRASYRKRSARLLSRLPFSARHTLFRLDPSRVQRRPKKPRTNTMMTMRPTIQMMRFTI